jgi:hypothetical protein
MIALSVTGLSVRAPGLGPWPQSSAVLAGSVPHDPDATLELPPPALLSPNERRRAGLVVKLALTVCEEASRMAGHAPGALPGIFGSSNGDGAVVHELLDALSGPDQALSPTRFHNSVHNAVAGYWAIATHSAASVTCLGCHDSTFAAALLKAGAEAASLGAPVMLCVYDAPMKLPLGALRTTTIGLAAAFVLEPGESAGERHARLRLGFRSGPPGPEPAPRQPALRALWEANPMGRSLVLLEAVAQRRAASFTFPYATGSLSVETAA